jgi:tetraacyldisaccharide-1-P 4'-kinase
MAIRSRFPGEAPIVQSLLAGNQSILLIVGIAGPEHIQKYLESFTSDITVLKFPDHTQLFCFRPE